MARAVTPRGNFVYVPDGEVLEAFFWDRSEFTCVQGPVGSGTSTACCQKIWAIACDQAPDYDGVRRTRWIVSRTTYKELRDTTLKTWDLWFPEAEWGAMVRSEPAYHHLKRKHPSGDGTVVDCEVIFLALPDPDTARKVLASFEITGFFVNEGQNVDKGVVTLLRSRCSRYPSKMNGPGPSWYGGFMDMNAPFEGHWVPYMRGDIPLPPDWTPEQKAEYARPDTWVFYKQPPGLLETRVDGEIVYQPNPKAENQKWLQEPYLQKIKGWPKNDIDMLILNKIGLSVAGMPVYPTFSEDEHVARFDKEPVPGFPIFVGLDFGRDPAACFGQNVNGAKSALSELIGHNESAELFAPRVKHHLMRHFPGYEFEFWGDPRGGDGTQATETTAFDVFQRLGMPVLEATTDNSPELRRSTVERVLAQRNGLTVNPGCITLKRGLAGGYHYKKIQGMVGRYSPRPDKGPYSHVVEAMENMLLGMGEGYATIQRPVGLRTGPSEIRRPRPMFRRRA